MSSNQNKFFTRSALMQQLIPNPSEGKIRALFGTGKQAIISKIDSMASKRAERMKHLRQTDYGDNFARMSQSDTGNYASAGAAFGRDTQQMFRLQ